MATPGPGRADVDRIGTQFAFLYLGRSPSDAGIVAPPTCAHPRAVPVESAVTDEVLAWLCPDCDVQLHAEWTDEMSEHPVLITDLSDMSLPPTMGKRIWLPS